MDRRTLRAALVADLVTFVAVAALGTFLGFDPVGSVIAGAVAGTLAFGLLYAASVRAATFTEPTAPDAASPDATTDPEDHR